MSLRIRYAVSAVALIAGTVPAAAQDVDRQTLRVAVADCDTLRSAATDPARTVRQRYESALEFEQCVEQRNAEIAVDASVGVQRNVQPFLSARKDDVAAVRKVARDQVEFKGLTWGVGFGYSFADEDIVPEAVLVDGVVRATEDRSDVPRAVLEFHKYFWCDQEGTDGDRGCGPFVAVAATDEEFLSGVGMGFMFGRRNEGDEDGFSVGIGAILDGDVRSLADGFAEGQPLPAGETAIRFKKESRWSALVFVTRTF